MARYTLRWPGHCAFWKALVDLHLLDPEPVVVDGVAVDRLRYLARALEPHLRLGDGERDIAMVRIETVGRRDGRPARAVHQVIDRRDLATGLTAMSRTVGFTAGIGAQMIVDGRIAGRGVLSPVRDVPYEPLVGELRRRHIEVTEVIAPWESAG
jgi:saccharopine dehydrogenase-like NADP-dependent oxidoreductase